MKKILISMLAIVVVMAACKKEEPLPDPNDVLADNIAGYKTYITKETDSENFIFEFLPGTPATETTAAVPGTYKMVTKLDPSVVKSEGFWEVRDSLLWLTKTGGVIEFSKVEGGLIKDEGRELFPKTGAKELHLYCE